MKDISNMQSPSNNNQRLEMIQMKKIVTNIKSKTSSTHTPIG